MEDNDAATYREPSSERPWRTGGVPEARGRRPQNWCTDTTLGLVEVRASHINGCSVCLDLHSRQLKAAGEPDERIFMVGAWREAPYFSDAERAALALTEAATRLADSPDPIPDEVWEQAARHYDETQLAGLVVAIATINAFNRVNAATRQITGDWVAQYVESTEVASKAA